MTLADNNVAAMRPRNEPFPPLSDALREAAAVFRDTEKRRSNLGAARASAQAELDDIRAQIATASVDRERVLLDLANAETRGEVPKRLRGQVGSLRAQLAELAARIPVIESEQKIRDKQIQVLNEQVGRARRDFDNALKGWEEQIAQEERISDSKFKRELRRYCVLLSSLKEFNPEGKDWFRIRFGFNHYDILPEGDRLRELRRQYALGEFES